MLARMHTTAGWLLVAAGSLVGTVFGHAQERRPGGAPGRDVVGLFMAADANAITITVTAGDGRGERGVREAPATKDEAFALSKNVEVAVPTGGTFVGGGRDGGGLFKEVKLAELAPGVRVVLSLSADQKTVEAIVAEGPMVRGQLKAVDATKNTLTIQLPAQGERGRDGGAAPAGEEKSYTLARGAEIGVNDGRGGRFSMKEAKLADLAQGAFVTARLSVNLKQIQFVLAEGPAHLGVIKAIDANKNSIILVVRPPRGDDAGEEHSLIVSTDAVVLLDDGKGRRLSVKPAKLADVPVGAMVAVKLSADQSFVMMLRAEGPMLIGQLKAVDADKGTIVLAIPKGRGEDPEEKTLSVAKDARVNIEVADSTLANLKVGENGPILQLRFSLDQKTVQSVIARQPGPR